jgi:hypothetical protein
VRSRLVLRSRSNGTIWESKWNFTGADERELRACLDQLDEFTAPDPKERWAGMKKGWVFEGDRWASPMVLFPDDPSFKWPEVPPADGAWTAEGALRLAELLPDTFADLRNDILTRFSR